MTKPKDIRKPYTWAPIVKKVKKWNTEHLLPKRRTPRTIFRIDIDAQGMEFMCFQDVMLAKHTPKHKTNVKQAIKGKNHHWYRGFFFVEADTFQAAYDLIEHELYVRRNRRYTLLEVLRKIPMDKLKWFDQFIITAYQKYYDELPDDCKQTP